MKRIYLYTKNSEKKQAIEKICSEQKVELCALSGGDVNRTVSDICGMPLKTAAKHKQAPLLYGLPELMLFYGIDDEALEKFLDAYKDAGIEKIRLKAVVTPTNLGWTLYELVVELGKESALI